MMPEHRLGRRPATIQHCDTAYLEGSVDSITTSQANILLRTHSIRRIASKLHSATATAAFIAGSSMSSIGGGWAQLRQQARALEQQVRSLLQLLTPQQRHIDHHPRQRRSSTHTHNSPRPPISPRNPPKTSYGRKQICKSCSRSGKHWSANYRDCWTQKHPPRLSS